MFIPSYIIRTQKVELFYLVVFEILIPKVRNVFIESPDIYIYIYYQTGKITQSSNSLSYNYSVFLFCRVVLFVFVLFYFITFYCISVIDYCEGNPCSHGYCESKQIGYTCTCEEGYEGKHCESGKLIIAFI